LNLADPNGFGAFNTMRAGITAKRQVTGLTKVLTGGTEILSFDLFTLMADDLARQLKDTDAAPIRDKCEGAKKIYLATHGLPTDTDHAFASAAGGNALCTYKQLAFFMLKLLPNRKKTYNLGLIMCYGARSASYRASALDHQGKIPAADLATSFAYKFFRQVCPFRKVRMTARTGAVAFSASSGRSQVEQEVAIDARVDKEEFLRDPAVLSQITAWQGEKKTRDRDPNLGPAWMAMNDRFKNDPFATAQDATEQTAKDYQAILRTKGGFQQIQDDKPDLEKYGKFVYTYEGSVLTIMNKYGGPKAGVWPEHVLYRGPLM
jgi:hypothetical protein